VCCCGWSGVVLISCGGEGGGVGAGSCARLAAFAAEMLGGLALADQRVKGELYPCGLMLDGKRKSMQPMA
jgi:hypothetical protein